MLRSHEIWRELEAETGAELLNQCGALILAPRAGAAVVHGKPGFVQATVIAATRHAIPHEVLDAAEVMRRFPQFRLRGDEIAYYEPGGGYVRPERCIAAQLALARRLGAVIRPNTPVAATARDGTGVRVTTAEGETFMAAEVVLAAGAWSSCLAGAILAPHMAVTRQVLHWFAAANPAAFAPGACPVYIWTHGDTASDGFYGFPISPGAEGVKVAVEQCAVTADPDQLQRKVSPAEAAAMHSRHLAGRLPGLLPRALRSAVCPYTVTPDGDFLVARVPNNPRMLLVSACSGHGFKHSAGLGEAVADALLTGALPASLARFAADRLTPAG